MKGEELNRTMASTHCAFFFFDLNPLHKPRNKNPPKQPTQGYREDAGLFLESDTDEQLLINIPFTQGKGEEEREKNDLGSPSLPPPLSLPVLLTHTSSKPTTTTTTTKLPFSSRQAHLHLDQGPRRRRRAPKSPRLRQQALARLLRGRVRPRDRRV